MNFPKSDPKLNNQDELRKLREENAQLKALLTQHDITWEELDRVVIVRVRHSKEENF
ncbi:MAG: hypothetical protein H6987_13880 [Pseudomonadales bacterium]|nr:hypothetical protein [Pseudomonadales bacterium]